MGWGLNPKILASHSIQLEIVGQNQERIPASYGLDFNQNRDASNGGAPIDVYSLTVHYQDGSEDTYDITGERDSIQTVNAPGYLTFNYSMREGSGCSYGDIIYYYYWYTEAGVSTYGACEYLPQ